MNDRQFNPQTNQLVAGTAGKAGKVVLFLLALVFIGFGGFALVQAVTIWTGSSFKDAAGIGVWGLIFVGIGVGVMALAVFGRKKSGLAAAMKAQHPDKPWLWREDWAAGYVKSSTKLAALVLWGFALLWNSLSWPIAIIAVPREWHKGNHAVLIALIFPLAGVFILAMAVHTTLVWRRFGKCVFEMASVPGALGGSLTGMIQTGARIWLKHGLHLKLSCIRRTVSGSGKDQSVREDILWQDEKVFKPEADLPEPEPGRSGIPVYFKLPADQPECYDRGDNAVVWRLEARSKMSGPDFSANFDVPVFRVAGAAFAEANEPDPTAELQMPVEEVRRDEQSKIQVSDGPAGREFYFPAARNPSMGIFFAVFFIIWTAVTLCIFFVKGGKFSSTIPMSAEHARLCLGAIFALVDVIVFIACVNIWLRSSRVTVDSTGVSVVKRWLVFSRTRRFEASEIARFEINVGITSGSQVFHDLKLVAKNSGNSLANRKAKYQQTGQLPPRRFRITSPGGYTLAGSIASKLEADWLVREMTKALGRTL